MTVAQLIAKLGQLHPDLQVDLITDEGISPCLGIDFSADGTTVFITDYETDDADTPEE